MNITQLYPLSFQMNIFIFYFTSLRNHFNFIYFLINDLSPNFINRKTIMRFDVVSFEILTLNFTYSCIFHKKYLISLFFVIKQ